MKLKHYVGLGLLVILLLIVFFAVQSARIGAFWKSQTTAEIDGGFYEESIRFNGQDYLVPVQDIVNSGFTNDSIPEITNPTYDSVGVADAYLDDSVYGIDIEVKGQHYFYSFQIMNWHQVVQTTIGGESLLVTHCPFCRSSNVFKTNELLKPAGQQYNTNSLLKDADGGLWSQLTGRAIVGDRVGETLETYPHTILTWGDWKRIYPSGSALSSDTGFSRDYSRHPYLDYDVNKTTYFPMNHTQQKLPEKWLVHGLELNGESYTYSKRIMQGFGVDNRVVGEQPIVAMHEFISDIVRVYEATTDSGQSLTFTYDFEDQVFTDDQTGSTWNAQGRAIDGELAGTQLKQIEAPESFAMCWHAHFPESFVVQVDDQAQENVTE